jgi:hypothetical protein
MMDFLFGHKKTTTTRTTSVEEKMYNKGKVDKLIKDRRNHLNSELSATVKVKLTKRVNTLQQMRLEQRIKELDWLKENL